MKGPRCRVCTGENVQYQQTVVQSNVGPIHWTAHTGREYDGHSISCGTDVYEDAKEEIASLRAKLAKAEERARDADSNAAYHKWPFFGVDGEEHCHEGMALAVLLREEVLLPNHRLYDPDTWSKPSGRTDGPTIVLFVIANDVFAWGCADAEPLTLTDVPVLFKAWHADRTWGVVRWLCRRRNEQPQGPIRLDMEAEGAWDLGDLPENGYDAICRKRAEEQAVLQPAAPTEEAAPRKDTT